MGRGSSTFLELAILSVLKDETPQNGYQIRKTLSGLCGSLLQFSFGSLYPALGRLEERAAIVTLGTGTGDSDFISTGSITGDSASKRDWLRDLVPQRALERSGRNTKSYVITDIGQKLYSELVEHVPLESERDVLTWLSLLDENSYATAIERINDRIATIAGTQRVKSRVSSTSQLSKSKISNVIDKRMADLAANEINFLKQLVLSLSNNEIQGEIASMNFGKDM
ncbi:MAG: helix-turn-helix transcriptional regulator [Actinomycetota bacterium]|nr:helix-turn-helix transcriptional regulator [Actinomycetota bacterium]